MDLDGGFSGAKKGHAGGGPEGGWRGGGMGGGGGRVDSGGGSGGALLGGLGMLAMALVLLAGDRSASKVCECQVGCVRSKATR